MIEPQFAIGATHDMRILTGSAACAPAVSSKAQTPANASLCSRILSSQLSLHLPQYPVPDYGQLSRVCFVLASNRAWRTRDPVQRSQRARPAEDQAVQHWAWQHLGRSLRPPKKQRTD
jgi:hypothetical protein